MFGDSTAAMAAPHAATAARAMSFFMVVFLFDPWKLGLESLH
jgi:hypothetical protein